MTEINRKLFKDKVLIFCVLHYNYDCVLLTLKNIRAIIDALPEVYMVLIDSHSDPKVKALFDSVSHPRIDKISLPINFGYNASVNFYVRDFINDETLPRVIIRLDADILFSQEDFERLIDAIDHLPQFGTIGMSYFKNDCNPELNTFFKAKKHRGSNQKTYMLKWPFMVPVAGGIMGFRGKLLKEDLDYEPFPMKHLPKRFLKTLPVGGADAALYNALKWKYKMGYLDNTMAYHLKSRDNTVLIVPDEYRHLLDSNL